MASTQQTVIVTGASQGIGAGIVRAFLERGYNVVGTARHATTSKELSVSERLALVDGDIGQMGSELTIDTAQRRTHGAADQVESWVFQLFETDATLESPAVCAAI